MKVGRSCPKWVADECADMQGDEAAVVERIISSKSELRGTILRGLERRSPRHPGVKRLSIVAWAINRGLQPRRGDARLTPKEKEALANKLEWAARELATAWKAVAAIEGGVPFQVQLGIQQGVLQALLAYEPTARRMHDAGPGHDVVSMERGLLNSAVEHIDDIAASIADGAAFWRRYKVPLAKPNHPTADRLYFARVLTEAFSYHFGTAMREEVSALTQIWFEDSGLTANALSEVAKVRDSEAVRWPPRLSQNRPPRN